MILSRRDYRTQPGVLTPGRDKNGTRPESGGREAFPALDAERDPQRISAAPSGRGPLVNVSWGRNPRLSPIVPSGQRILYDLNICPHFRSHIRSVGVLRQHFATPTPLFEHEHQRRTRNAKREATGERGVPDVPEPYALSPSATNCSAVSEGIRAPLDR